MSKKCLKPHRERLLRKQNNRCWYCGCNLILDKEKYLDSQSYCVDRLTPVIKGGSNLKTNLVAARRLCNSQKSRKSLDEYRRWLQLKQCKNTRAAGLAGLLRLALRENIQTLFNAESAQAIECLESQAIAIEFSGEKNFAISEEVQQ